jgi:LysM repeat protein
MRINDLLLESTIKNDPIFESAYRGSKLLAELNLNPKQITKIFQAVADGAAKGQNDGSNRTVLGKGADAVTSVSQAFDKVKAKISQSGPVSGFDAAFDKMQTQILNAAGGDKGAVGKTLTSYREFANKHPIMQGAVYAGLIALAGISGAGLGGAAILGGIKLFDRLLQGDKASSALWKGFKTGAVAYAAGQIGKAMQGDAAATTNPTAQPTAPEVPQTTAYSVTKGDTLSDIAKANDVSVKDLLAANKNLTNPDALKVGTELNIPKSTLDPTYAQNVGTAKDTAAKVASGEYDQYADALGKQGKAAAKAATDTATDAATSAASSSADLGPDVSDKLAKYVSSKYPSDQFTYTNDGQNLMVYNKATGAKQAMFDIMNDSVIRTGTVLDETVIDRQATVWTWALNEGLGRPHGGVLITSVGVNKIFETVVNEGPMWDKVKAGAGKVAGAVGDAAKRGWEDASNKITYNKLDLNWRRGEGRDQTGPVDSEILAAFLRKQGVTDGLLSSVYKKMKIPFNPAVTPQANTSTNRQPRGQGTSTQSAAPTSRTRSASSTTGTTSTSGTTGSSSAQGFTATASLYSQVKDGVNRLDKKGKQRIQAYLQKLLPQSTPTTKPTAKKKPAAKKP